MSSRDAFEIKGQGISILMIQYVVLLEYGKLYETAEKTPKLRTIVPIWWEIIDELP